MVRDIELSVELTTHVLRNIEMDKDRATGGNLVLAVQSPPGEGKTYHCKVVLGELGVRILRFPIADLESPGAGLPAVRIIESYIEASEFIEKGEPTVLVLEDADLGIGRADNSGEVTQFTMNRSLVTGALMSLCDAPTLVNIPAESRFKALGNQKLCRRVPIVMTGNNLRTVYPALFRDGRARIFDWRASDRTKVEFLLQELPDADPIYVRSVIEEFDGCPISFWESVLEHLRHGHTRDMVREWVTRVDLPTLTQMMEASKEPRPRRFTVGDVLDAARTHREARKEWAAR